MRKLKYGLLGGAAALAAAMALPALSRAEPGMGGHGARLFEMTDTDKSGDISKAEMQAAAEARFEAADKNGDGVLTKDESDAARAEMHEKMKAYRGDPAERFAAADADGDGRLTLDEMKEAAAKRMAEHGREGDMPGRHADRMEKFFEKADADGDGALTEDEMKAAGEKMKKRGSAPPALILAENPDILAGTAAGRKRPTLLIGFAAETETVIDHAKAKLARKGCDLIVANDVSHETGIMGGDRNRVRIVSKDGVEDWPDLSKDEVAGRLAARIAEFVASKS